LKVLLDIKNCHIAIPVLLLKVDNMLYVADHAMSRDTVIVGDERAQFLYRSGVESQNDYGSSEYFPAAVALVFARDRDKPCGIGLLISVFAISSFATKMDWQCADLFIVESHDMLSHTFAALTY
jgi:hypothetical protein